MVFSLDFDNTFTEDPVFWKWFILKATTRGHKVFCVTARTEEQRNIDEVEDSFGSSLELIEDVVFCNHLPKKDIVDKLGINIDVWIDDKPETIILGL
jgi:hypothetical protein